MLLLLSLIGLERYYCWFGCVVGSLIFLIINYQSINLSLSNITGQCMSAIYLMGLFITDIDLLSRSTINKELIRCLASAAATVDNSVLYRDS